jgi:hypothetical protein
MSASLCLFLFERGMKMIKCSNEKTVREIRSTEEILKYFDLEEGELIWYIKATELQLSSPGSTGLRCMGREIECSYGLDSPVEADFAPILKEDNSIHILVALDYKRLVLFVDIGNYMYEIWVDYVCRKADYLFYERLYTLRHHYSDGEREHF